MNISKKIFRKVLLASIAAMAANAPAHAQLDLNLDTLECHIVGFNIGTKIASNTFSFGQAPDGSTSKSATMAGLYRNPYMDYGLNAIYKYKSNWLVTLEGDLWFGNNNLLYRKERMGSVYTHDSTVIGMSGTDASVTAYNRGFSIQGGFGKIFPLNAEKNPNSGIMARLSGGYFLQQTIFMAYDEKAPQVEDDYGLLYDHQRRGAMLTESVGYWFMSNHANLLNMYVELGVSQMWSWSTRDYVIDNLLGMHGKDGSRYFDLVYTIKFCWMFPLRGKASHDYYFY